MRSDPPFFLDHLTNATLEAAAQTAGQLSLYCGAGVTIDRTGHSWSSLVLAGFPKRRGRVSDAPTQRQITKLQAQSPEQLASSLVYVLRESAGSKKALQDALRKRLRTALYGNPSRWQRGELANWLVILSVMRAQQSRATLILTTNYDDYIEEAYSNVREALEGTASAIPGLRVRRAGVAKPLVELQPRGLTASAPGAYIDLVYLHGRLPRTGPVSWPLVLDENSYAITAPAVEEAISVALNESALSILLGTSLRDTPLIRALSATRSAAGERVAVLTRGQFANADPELEKLTLLLARHRSSELRYAPLFPDFNSQPAQFITELTLKTAVGQSATSYTERMNGWWNSWVSTRGPDPDIPSRLREAVTSVLPLLGCDADPSPLAEDAERFQLEMWVRADPAGPARSLTRWARSLDALTAGVKGKTASLERDSYLAPIRCFTEGRAGRFDIGELERGRESDARYTWRSFLCVPIRVRFCTVGVLTLASTLPLAATSMSSSEEAVAQVVQILKAEGTRLFTADS